MFCRSLLSCFFALLVLLVPRPSWSDIRISCAGEEQSRSLAQMSVRADCPTCFTNADVVPAARAVMKGVATCKYKKVNVAIENKISYADAEFFRVNAGISSETGFNPIHIVTLNSDGGYVDAAISLARDISKLGNLTIVDGRCYSSCVLILAAARKRYFIGNDVGVHRLSVENLPSNVGTDSKSVDLYFETKYSQIEIILRENGISRNFFDILWSTPSTSLKLIDFDELVDNGFGYLNTAYAESLRYKISKKFGERGVKLLSETMMDLDACMRTCGPDMMEPLVDTLSRFEASVE